MHALNGMLEGRPISFPKNILTDLDNVIGSQPYKELVKGRMMKVTESNPVSHDGLALWLPVGNDMRRIQKLIMPKPAKSALPAISLENALSERPLMKPDSHCRRDITAARGFALFADRRSCLGPCGIDAQMALVVDSNRKRGRQRIGIITDDKDRPSSDIAAARDPMKIGQGQAIRHGRTKPTVIPMVGIDAPIAIAEQAICAESVIIWAIGSRRNRKREIKDPGLEYSLRPHKRDSHILEEKALSKRFPGQHVPIPHDLIGKPIKCGRSHSRVLGAVEHF